MKKIFFLAILLASSFNFLIADTYVNGYTRKDGTYVQGHYRSSPNSTKNDNYSTYGNTNPYTGEAGTKRGDSYNSNSNSYNYNNSYGTQKPYDYGYGK